MLLSPLKGEPPFITQEFGKNPQIYKQFGLKGHNGLDIRAKSGTQLYAPIEGVVSVGNQGSKGYGKFIRIRNNTNECILAHLSKIEVQDGQLISLGDPIGKSGNTGFSTAAHLHFGLRKVKSGKILNEGNGFSGYLNQLPYMLVWNLFNK